MVPGQCKERLRTKETGILSLLLSSLSVTQPILSQSVHIVYMFIVIQFVHQIKSKSL